MKSKSVAEREEQRRNRKKALKQSKNKKTKNPGRKVK